MTHINFKATSLCISVDGWTTDEIGREYKCAITVCLIFLLSEEKTLPKYWHFLRYSKNTTYSNRSWIRTKQLDRTLACLLDWRYHELWYTEDAFFFPFISGCVLVVLNAFRNAESMDFPLKWCIYAYLWYIYIYICELTQFLLASDRKCECI